MDDAGAVGRVDAFGHLGHDRQLFFKAEFGGQLPQIRAFDALHHQVGAAPMLADIEDLGHMRVFDPGLALGLGAKALQELLALVVQDLDRHQPPEGRVPSLENPSHPAGAEHGMIFIPLPSVEEGFLFGIETPGRHRPFQLGVRIIPATDPIRGQSPGRFPGFLFAILHGRAPLLPPLEHSLGRGDRNLESAEAGASGRRLPGGGF